MMLKLTFVAVIVGIVLIARTATLDVSSIGGTKIQKEWAHFWKKITGYYWLAFAIWICGLILFYAPDDCG